MEPLYDKAFSPPTEVSYTPKGERFQRIPYATRIVFFPDHTLVVETVGLRVYVITDCERVIVGKSEPEQ